MRARLVRKTNASAALRGGHVVAGKAVASTATTSTTAAAAADDYDAAAAAATAASLLLLTLSSSWPLLSLRYARYPSLSLAHTRLRRSRAASALPLLHDYRSSLSLALSFSSYF